MGRKYMKTHPNSSATVGVRAWLRNRREWRLVCREDGDQNGRALAQLTGHLIT
jgi:hypothetical protein